MSIANTEPTGVSVKPHVVSCHSCGTKIDAATAAWCRCVGKRLNVQCEHCGHCLCKAGDRAVSQFWASAPGSIAERRRIENDRRVRAGADATTVIGDILVVDDDEEIRLIASYMLRGMGYTVSIASTPEQALLMVERDRPRVVLTDALMPKMDGRQLCRLIKVMNRSIKVVIMTSLYTGARYKSEAFKKFHADDYLAKPIDFDVLREVMNRLAPVYPSQAVAR